MKAGFKSEHWTSHSGKPAGGCTFGNGFTISWQNGPLGRGDGRREPNGAFVEDVIDAVIDRIEFYQSTEFACIDSDDALKSLRMAAESLAARTRDREKRQVEGTHQT